MLSFYALTGWFTSVTALLIGVFVYAKNSSGEVHRRWGILNLFISFWSFFLGLMFVSSEPRIGLMWSRLLMIGAIFIPPTFYHFVLSLLELKPKQHFKTILVGGYTVAFFLLLLAPTPLFVKSASYKPLVRCFYPDAGPFFIFYIISYFLLLGYSGYLMIRSINTLPVTKRNQISYVIAASAVGFLGGATTFPLWYQIPLSPWGSHLVWLYTLTITYAILKYRLMDITVAITRTTIFIAVYSLVLGFPFAVAAWLHNELIALFGERWWIIPLGLMGVMATVGPFIFIYLERKAEETLLKEQRRYQKILKQASVGMTRIRNLKKLLELITHIVTKTVHISYAAIYLFHKENNEFILQVSRDKERIPLPR
ncbi:MAG: hypothetical protein KKC84_02700, partial [Candidatus Omnitrophica bacterium]|nr:hypothetical protein [Candidatus Omnitrophota bacterium]